MNSLIAALYTESLKVLKSKILWITMIFFMFIAVMMGFLMLVAKHPEIAGKSAILSTKASFISEVSWIAYFELLKQLVLVLGVIGPGVVITWIFGREYTDRTIKDILVLPVSRISIVTSKFLVGFIWSFILVLILLGAGILIGFAIQLEGWTTLVFLNNIGVLVVSSLMTILLFTPVALITCISRGFLLPVGVLILIMIVTQFIFVGFPSFAPLFPWAIPALYSGVAGPLSSRPELISYIILGVTSIMGFAGTAVWWRYADQH